MPAKGQKIDKTTGKYALSTKQSRAFEIMLKQPELSAYQALIRAGYSKNTASSAKANFMDRVAVSSMKDQLGYELIRKQVTPKYIAQLTKQGLESKDSKVVLEYIKEVKKDLNISTEATQNAIQINLTGEISKLAE